MMYGARPAVVNVRATGNGAMQDTMLPMSRPKSAVPVIAAVNKYPAEKRDHVSASQKPAGTTLTPGVMVWRNGRLLNMWGVDMVMVGFLCWAGVC